MKAIKAYFDRQNVNPNVAKAEDTESPSLSRARVQPAAAMLQQTASSSTPWISGILDFCNVRGKTEVLVVFPDNSQKVSPQKARRLLRGSPKGEGLVKKLLRSLAEDTTLDGK